jgi:Reverse transcriptase (RNA-dependent DNA polymerase)/Zinc knuckle
MNGNVFECYDEQQDRRQFAKTMEALEAYVKKNLRYAEDLSNLFLDDMVAPAVEEPVDPAADGTTKPTKLQEMVYIEQVKGYVKRLSALTSNLATVHAVIWGQCSEAMKAKMKALKGYKEKTEANDCFWFLKQLKAVTMQFDEKRYKFMSLLDARTSMLNCKQLQGQTASDYLEVLRGWADTIEYHGGTVAENYTLIDEKDTTGKVRTESERKMMARDRTLATLFIRRADPTRYGTLLADLSNNYAMGKDDYPADLTAAYSLLVNYKTPTNVKIKEVTAHVPVHATATVLTAPPEATAMTFAQKAAHDGVTCYKCKASGHYAADCPVGTNAGTTLVQHALSLAQTKGASDFATTGIDPDWILLDSQSTISVFKNPHMLQNIRKSEKILRAITNGGHQDSTMIGDFPNLGAVWYNPDSIANILSLADVRKICRISMDSSVEPVINVHRLDGSLMKFVEHESGLYVYSPNNASNNTVSAYTIVSTVAEQKKLFSPREIKDADQARVLYRKIGRPSEAEFQTILRSNLIRNCPVTPADAQRALIIYGPDIATIKGTTTRSEPSSHLPTFEAVPLPPPILEHHMNVTLCVDFFFVQGIAFLHTISRGIGFRTVSYVTDRNKPTIVKEMKAVLHLYQCRGFTINDIHCDNEFACLRDLVRPIQLNVVPADSHVGEIERSIRTIKERLRSMVHGLPFKRLPKLMIVHMVSDTVRCLNQFPWKHGISETLSPSAIVVGYANPDFNNMRIEFGTYAQVFEEQQITNTPRARTLGAIALNPTGNAQGDYFFMSLATGNKISRHNWTELPITDTAIARVEALGFQDEQPLIQERGFVVEWRHDHPIDDFEYDRNYTPPARVLNAEERVMDVLEPIQDDELADLLEDAEDENVFVANDPPPQDDDDAPDDDAAEDDDEPAGNASEEPDVGADDNDADDEPEPGDDANDDDAPAGTNDNAVNDNIVPAGHGYHLRDRTTRYGGFNAAMDNPHDGRSYYPPVQLPPVQLTQTGESVKKRLFGFVMTQMTAKAGIKKYGKAAEAALIQEFGQLEHQNVYEPIHPKLLTRAQRRGALRAINLIKEKRDGKLKGRTVADGSTQRPLYEKHETASPTLSSDALLLSILMDAYEGRDVAIADIAGAYLNAYMPDFVIMKFTGESVDILCEMNPEYEEFVVTENGVRVLYVRLIKALYGCVKSALLWYELFQTTLQQMGFVLNPYDQCVANCDFEGTQCTVAWYVDDTKISHINPDVVTMVIDKLESRFDKMTVTRGKEHEFLGMKIRFTEERTAVITMKSYLEEAIVESNMDIVRQAATPANRYLFDVDEDSPLLGKTEAETFHSVVAKLLYVSLRGRTDLLLAISFLCTRVSKCTDEDQRKLKRVLEYIKGSMDLEYTIGADDIGNVRTWVDASYAVHPDMKSHTGGVMSFGTGGFLCKSSKQKLNTKSSTEAELVGASDYLPNTIWVKNFMLAQGYVLNENVLEQDNESAIKLEKNGRSSAGPKSRHIDIRFFWMKDRVQQEDILIRHCPTLQMLADFFTKPLQGALFRRFRDVLLGYKHVNTLLEDLQCHATNELPSTATTLSPVEERVGNNNRADENTVTEKYEEEIDDEGFELMKIP